MNIQELKVNVEQVIHEYEKDNENNFYYTNIKDLKWVLEMVNKIIGER